VSVKHWPCATSQAENSVRSRLYAASVFFDKPSSSHKASMKASINGSGNLSGMVVQKKMGVASLLFSPA
jgi:hypothetical protein